VAPFPHPHKARVRRRGGGGRDGAVARQRVQRRAAGLEEEEVIICVGECAEVGVYEGVGEQLTLLDALAEALEEARLSESISHTAEATDKSGCSFRASVWKASSDKTTSISSEMPVSGPNNRQTCRHCV
jgi:hypothetical protein